MNTISSRSVRATPKTAAKRATNGTRPIDLDFEDTSSPSTETPEREGVTTTWRVQDESDRVYLVEVKGGRGRVSIGGSPAALGRGGGRELRIYRNETTKTFDAFFPAIKNVWSDRVSVVDAGKDPIAKMAQDEKAAQQAKIVNTTLEKVVKGHLKAKWPSPFDEEDDDEIVTVPDPELPA